MFLLYKFGDLVARYRARKLVAAGQADDEEEALGGGDVYLAGILGLMMGWPVVLALIYGALLGGLVSLIFIVALLIRRRYSGGVLMTFIPYGPFLIIGAFYVLFFL
jgi:leader peptidase (prepilin peptidase)/N-methyltransferase